MTQVFTTVLRRNGRGSQRLPFSNAAAWVTASAFFIASSGWAAAAPQASVTASTICAFDTLAR